MPSHYNEKYVLFFISAGVLFFIKFFAASNINFMMTDNTNSTISFSSKCQTPVVLNSSLTSHFKNIMFSHTCVVFIIRNNKLLVLMVDRKKTKKNLPVSIEKFLIFGLDY